MFTLFDVATLIAAFTGAIVGALLGHAWLGGWGLLPGGILGIVGGFYLGRVPLVVSLWELRRKLERTSDEDLLEQLQQRYFISHLIIAKLVTRGHDPQDFRVYVDSLVASSSSDKRRFGWYNMRVWFPERAAALEGFEPGEAHEQCLERIRRADSVDEGLDTRAKP